MFADGWDVGDAGNVFESSNSIHDCNLPRWGRLEGNSLMMHKKKKHTQWRWQVSCYALQGSRVEISAKYKIIDEEWFFNGKTEQVHPK